MKQFTPLISALMLAGCVTNMQAQNRVTQTITYRSQDAEIYDLVVHYGAVDIPEAIGESVLPPGGGKTFIETVPIPETATVSWRDTQGPHSQTVEIKKYVSGIKKDWIVYFEIKSSKLSVYVDVFRNDPLKDVSSDRIFIAR